MSRRGSSKAPPASDDAAASSEAPIVPLISLTEVRELIASNLSPTIKAHADLHLDVGDLKTRVTADGAAIEEVKTRVAHLEIAESARGTASAGADCPEFADRLGRLEVAHTLCEDDYRISFHQLESDFAARMEAMEEEFRTLKEALERQPARQFSDVELLAKINERIMSGISTFFASAPPSIPLDPEPVAFGLLRFSLQNYQTYTSPDQIGLDQNARQQCRLPTGTALKFSDDSKPPAQLVTEFYRR